MGLLAGGWGNVGQLINRKDAVVAVTVAMVVMPVVTVIAVLVIIVSVAVVVSVMERWMADSEFGCLTTRRHWRLEQVPSRFLSGTWGEFGGISKKLGSNVKGISKILGSNA